MPLNSMLHDGGGTEGISGCNSVPYPFGARGDAIEGFEVVCTSPVTQNRTKYLPSGNWTQDKLVNPSLLLPTGTYLIQNISLQGQVRILTGPIYQQCYNNRTEKLTPETGWLNLTGTPFTLSNDTTFVAIGCDDVVTIESVDRNSNNSSKSFRSGCVAFCNNSSSRIDGSCSGLGCCQMPLPGPGGLKSFELNLYRVEDMRVDRLTNCSAAFFTTRDGFSFQTTYFDNENYFSASGADHVAVLDWAIGEKSCDEAEKDVNSFACKNNSQCYNSLNGVGYLCNCSQGYEGNPYVEGGCRGKLC
jgi:Wall-associated kinase